MKEKQDEITFRSSTVEYMTYVAIQDRLFMSDFDKYMLELEENAKK